MLFFGGEGTVSPGMWDLKFPDQASNPHILQQKHSLSSISSNSSQQEAQEKPKPFKNAHLIRIGPPRVFLVTLQSTD